MAYLDETGLKHLWDKIIDKIYPVGSIYMSVNSTSPATIYGGTWEQIKGKFLLAEDGSTYKAGTEGGEATHKLTVNEMPSHSHANYAYLDGNTVTLPAYINTFKNNVIGTPGSNHDVPNGATYGNGMIEIFKMGGDAAHNNMPPYLAVYVWKRTA